MDTLNPVAGQYRLLLGWRPGRKRPIRVIIRTDQFHSRQAMHAAIRAGWDRIEQRGGLALRFLLPDDALALEPTRKAA